MTNDQFNKIVKEQIDYNFLLLQKKKEEYNNEVDRLAFFKKAASLQNITPKQSLAGMLSKHIISIYDMVNVNNINIDLWGEKITDIINYLLLLKALVIEENEEIKNEKI